MQRHKPLAEILVYLPPYLSKFQPPILSGCYLPTSSLLSIFASPPYILTNLEETSG